MKNIFTLLFLLVATSCFAQKRKVVKHTSLPVKKKAIVKRKIVTQEEDVVFQKVKNEAGFIGGPEALEKFIQTNLRTDVPNDNNAPAGKYTVIVKFVICKDGSLSNFVLENNPGYGMGDEAIRLLKTSPNWKPYETGGLKVSFVYRQPINFVVLYNRLIRQNCKFELQNN